MAAFTSTQTGNWDDGATWGNTSPGVKGTDWPGIAGDTATIADTHVVTYNVSETNALGIVTINDGGELTFSPSMDTLLTLGNVDLLVNNGGTLTIGTALTPIDKAYTAKINISSTSTNNAFTANGYLSIYGDPDFYGNTFSAIMASDWTTGQTFTIVGDLTTKWAAGNTLALIKDGGYSNQATDMVYVTIASVAANGGNTDITINESFPTGTYSTNSTVYNIGRNVMISLNGSLTFIQNTYDSSSGSIFTDPTDSGGNSVRCDIQSCMFMNCYSFSPIRSDIVNVVLMSNYQGVPSTANLNVSENLFVGYFGVGSSAVFVEWIGNIVIYRPGTLGFYGCNLDLILIGIGNFSQSRNSNISFYAYKTLGTTSSIWQCEFTNDSNISAVFGENENGLSYYGSEELFYFQSSTNIRYSMGAHFQTLTIPTTSHTSLFYGENNSFYFSNTQFFTNSLNSGGPASYSNYAALTYETADGSGSLPSQRSGGNDSVWQIVSLSNATVESRASKVPIDFNYYTTASSTKTFRVYFQTDYASAAEYRVKFFHPDIGYQTVTGTITTRASSSDWTQYAEFASINFTTAAWVKISVFVWGYEASNYIWVDPLVEVS